MENILDYKNVSETADEQKLIKVKALMDLGIEPYPHNYDRNINSAELKQKYDYLQAGEKLEDTSFKVAGRLMLRRDMGKAMFLDIHDENGKIQIYLSKPSLTEANNLKQSNFSPFSIFDMPTENDSNTIIVPNKTASEPKVKFENFNFTTQDTPKPQNDDLKQSQYKDISEVVNFKVLIIL